MDNTHAIIKTAVHHSKLSVVKSQFVTTRSHKSIFVHFDIDTPDWDNTAITAIFNGEYIRVLNEEYMCDIPEEVLTEEGTFTVGLFGIKDDYRINTNQICFKVWEGCYDEGMPSTDITQTLYEQIMAAIAVKADKTYVDNELSHKADIHHTHDISEIEGYTEITEETIEEWGFAKDSGYVVPEGGIPLSDLSDDVQELLDKANTALQKETDPTVPEWAKQPEKPTYTYNEIQGIPPEVDLTRYATEEYVDNEIKTKVNKRVVQKVEDYLYYIEYDELDYDVGEAYFLNRYNPDFGACSSIRNGHFYGRNYDWHYDENASFVINRKATKGKYASIGVSSSFIPNDIPESGEYDERYNYLPFLTLDGINEKGVVCNINVLPELNQKSITTGTNPGKPNVPMACLVRRILDEASSADDAIYKIQHEYNIIAPSREGLAMEMHFMIADKDKTYVVEFIDNAVVIIDKFVNDKPIMTNFYLVDYDGTRESLDPYAMGIERYDILANGFDNIKNQQDMIDLMRSVMYSRAYSASEDPVWCSEFAGQYEMYGNLTKDSSIENYTPLLEYVRNIFANRTRDSKTWQTVHSSVYDIPDKKLCIAVQENDRVYEFKLDILGELAKNISSGDQNVQADWNQNDETADDYIKNRTHYESCNLGDIVTEGHIIYYGNDDISRINDYDYRCELEPGRDYMVTVNGVSLLCHLYQLDEYYWYLSDVVVHDYMSSDFKFYVTYTEDVDNPGTYYLTDFTLDKDYFNAINSTGHGSSISIQEYNYQLKKLDDKFIERPNFYVSLTYNYNDDESYIPVVNHTYGKILDMYNKGYNLILREIDEPEEHEYQLNSVESDIITFISIYDSCVFNVIITSENEVLVDNYNLFSDLYHGNLMEYPNEYGEPGQVLTLDEDGNQIWANSESKNKIFYSYNEASEYAATDPSAYIGQSITVVDEENDMVTVYVISNSMMELSPVGGSSSISSYNELSNKPQINGVTLMGNKTAEDLDIDTAPLSNSDIEAIFKT